MGWYFGRTTEGTRGFFPGNHVKLDLSTIHNVPDGVAIILEHFADALNEFQFSFDALTPVASRPGSGAVRAIYPSCAV